MGKVIMIICLVSIAVMAKAQDDQSLLIKGNELYKNKQYDDAANQYKKAADINEKNPKAQYNLGNALYRSNKNTGSLQNAESRTVYELFDSLIVKIITTGGISY